MVIYGLGSILFIVVRDYVLAQSRETLRSGLAVVDLVGSKSGDFAQRILCAAV